MSKRMLIDGAHPEEIRVVVSSGPRLDEYDIETTFKKQFKGNIYLAKVTRVEPSLQAAFVDFGGNRHGFLAFSEIHPDYYQIPIEDRQALIDEQEELELKARAAQEHLEDMEGGISEAGDGGPTAGAELPFDPTHDEDADDAEDASMGGDGEFESGAAFDDDSNDREDRDDEDEDEDTDDDRNEPPPSGEDAGGRSMTGPDAEDDDAYEAAEASTPRHSRAMRRYKIQEVIKRRQILLVQVVKEERGNKGAALTTYISLAGRYCVLMPNSSRGGGISRKITSAQERRKLRDTLNALDIPQGMGVIIRTAGLERSKSEIRRDFEYLLRAWDEVREVTLESTAPSMVYEEGNIIKRAIRDVYSKDIDEILVDGNETYQTAKRFMRLMMPSHAKRVQPYRDETVPLFQRFQIEQQLDAMHNPEVQLKSGGYIVINPTEALVAIDVNSGKSTRERNIEETALKTNLEAADEVARQLRLRDLAGLIVIDFIDMEDSRNVRKVERRLREAMKVDRARLQIGRISNFGLLELSRQRLRPSLLETSTQICPHCRGTGHILSTESMAMRVLRAIEEEGIRMRSSEITVRVPTVVALYILNQKRATLVDMEARYGFGVILQGDDSVIPPDVEIERVKGRPEPSQSLQARSIPIEIEEDIDEDIEDEIEDEDAEKADDDRTERVSTEEEAAEKAQKRGRRRRGRRRGRDEQPRMETDEAGMPAGDAESAAEAPEADTDSEAAADSAAGEGGEGDEEKPRRRRRGRRGGRRRGRGAGDTDSSTEDPDAAETGAGDDLPVAEDDREPLAAMTDAPEAPAVREAAEAAAEIEVREESVTEAIAAALSEEPVSARTAPQPEADEAEDEEPAAQRPARTEREPEPVSRSPAAPQGEFAETTVEDRPKRKGWWQRIVE